MHIRTCTYRICILRTCTYNKNKCVPLKFRPALDVPPTMQQGGDRTRFGACGCALGTWQLHVLATGACLAMGSCGGSRAQRDSVVARRMSYRDESISNLGCKHKTEMPCTYDMTHELADASLNDVADDGSGGGGGEQAAEQTGLEVG